MHRPVIIVALALLVTPPAFGWHETGHKTTAALAWRSLDPGRQQEVFRVLQAHPRFAEDFLAAMPPEIASGTGREQGRWLLERASIWPDLVPRLGDDVRTTFHRSRWHYINMLVWLQDQDEAALKGRLEHNRETIYSPPLRQNLNIVQALRGNLAVWRSTAASDAEKAVALCWIVHLGGDLHQPLHTVALYSEAWFPEGDRGGNSIEVQWGDETRNLHAVWDGLPTGMEDLSPTARTIQSIEDDVVNDAAIDEWLSHHANLARRFVYTPEVKSELVMQLAADNPPIIELSREYLISARAIARRQVNLAGHRIAALLE